MSLDKLFQKLKGGPGSGNFGHGGRPGKRGGSMPSVYHRYGYGNPMSDWGHAMFAKGDPWRVSHYGNTHYTFNGKAPHVNEVLPDIKKRILEDVEQGYSNLDWDEFNNLGINEDNIDEFLNLYNPTDIVNTAGAWDNSYLLAAVASVLEDKNIDALLLDDGAIVFDKNLIKETK